MIIAALRHIFRFNKRVVAIVSPALVNTKIEADMNQVGLVQTILEVRGTAKEV